MRGAPVTVPGGSWIGGSCHRDTAAMVPAERSTALLARCLTSIGPSTGIVPELTRSLTVGDREALLLQLRRLTFGDDMPCLVSCPAPGCGERLDLPLRVGGLLLPPYPQRPQLHERSWTSGDRPFRVRFHLPTGADQEAAAAAATEAGAAAGARVLLRRCVEELEPSGSPSGALPDGIAEQLDDALAELDPQAELRLRVQCPRCGSEFATVLDAGEYLYQEINGRARHLYREVHVLALHYHWGERELMGMTARERSRYLGLLDESGVGARR